MWIKKFLNKLKIKKTIRVCTLYRDNKIIIILIKNTMTQVQIKPIDVQHYYV